MHRDASSAFSAAARDDSAGDHRSDRGSSPSELTFPMAHQFSFFRAGGSSYQVSLETGADIAAVVELDQKLWLAIACPVHGLEVDEKTLALVDTDHDGRIRPPEIIEAIRFMQRALHDLDSLVEREGTLELEHIDDTNDDGKALLVSAKKILENLDKADEDSISLEEVLDTERIFVQTKFNGDGIVPAESADDAFVKGVLEDIIAHMGSEKDRSGKPGVSRPKVEAFFDEATALSKWWRAADDTPGLLAVGAQTDAAFDAFIAVESKIEDFFVRCQSAAFDPRAQAALNRSEADWAVVSPAELSAHSAALAAFPLARVEAGRALPLESGLNPAWVDAMRAFKTKAFTPLVSGDKQSLLQADFAQLRTKLEAFREHRSKKPVTSLDAVPRARIDEILSSKARAAIGVLIDKDEAVKPESDAIASVEKLIRYHRDLHRLLCNFVSFRDFYVKGDAVFQCGTLYLDERSCALCVRVQAAAPHAEVAGASNTFLVYCECTRRDVRDGAPQPPEKMTIVAALTAGDEERIHALRNGVFYDRHGHDWDATVIKVVKQAISVREAFWLPYKRIGRFIGEQIEKFAGDNDKSVHESMKENVTGVAKTAATAEEIEKPFDVARFAGILAAVGLAIGAIGSALAVVLASFLGLSWWQMPLAGVGVVIAISGPSMLIAYVKLRGRMLGPILDGAGWAVNGEARINIAFGTSLTQRGELPKGSKKIPGDLYADKKNGWIVWVLVILILAAAALWQLGYLKPWLIMLAKTRH